MNFAIRVDASFAIGSGHVMRCLALAEALRTRGVESQFICRRDPHGKGEVIAKRDFSIVEFSAADDVEDALITSRFAANAPWLIVDNYSLGTAWEERARSPDQRILAIDDLADRHHSADLVVDSTFPGDQERYAGLVDGELLVGTRYALLAHSYRLARRLPSPISRENARTFAFFGATDVSNFSAMTLRALDRLGIEHVTLVLGSNYPYSASLRPLLSQHPKWAVVTSLPTLAPLISSAELAITGGGVTLLERLCVGTPGVTVSLAANQFSSVMALARAGATQLSGTSESLTEDDLRRSIRELVADSPRALRMAEFGRRVVDGYGADRLAERLAPTPTRMLSLRRATEMDISLYFDWVNDPEVRRQSLHTADISWDEHQSWYTIKCRDESSHLFILQAHDLPLAQARFEERQGRLVLDYSVDTCFRGRGLGAHAIRRSLESLPNSTPRIVDAHVRVGNSASLATLTGIGFRILAEESDAETLTLRLER